jgi:hypothetical protein
VLGAQGGQEIRLGVQRGLEDLFEQLLDPSEQIG